MCVLCRLFDGQRQARIHLETQALELILSSIRKLDRELMGSTVHDAEINAIRDVSEHQHLRNLLVQLGSMVSFDMLAIHKRAENLVNEGMGAADVAHVAFAEFTQADFVSVDDRLIKQCMRLNLV